MKFGSQKVNFVNSDRSEVSDPEFLTFRNNNNGQSNTGRTVFSQKLEMYRSLEKAKEDDDEDEELAPVRNFKKNNTNLRLLKSQQKLPSRHYTPVQKLRQQQQKPNPTKPFPSPIPTNQYPSSHHPTSQLTSAQYQFKNQLLKKKILKLAKSIKNQQRRQISLQKDIQQLHHEIQQDSKQIYSQCHEIEELQGINRENEVYLTKLTQNYEEFERKNYHLQGLVEKIEEALENLVNTGRQEDARVKMAAKLKEGLTRLQALKLQVTNRCMRIEGEIVKLKELVEQGSSLDENIRNMTLKIDSQSVSQFSCC